MSRKYNLIEDLGIGISRKYNPVEESWELGIGMSRKYNPIEELGIGTSEEQSGLELKTVRTVVG